MRPLLIFAVIMVMPEVSFSLENAQSQDCPPNWTIEYSVNGGLAGIHQVLLIRNDETAQVQGRPGKVDFTVAQDRFARICHLVEACDVKVAPKPSNPPEIPDVTLSSLTIRRDKQECQLGDREGEMLAEIGPVMADGLSRIEDERWKKAGPFPLGRVWHVQEEVRDAKGFFRGEIWEGTWTRKDDSNLFDAVWRDNFTHKEIRDKVAMDSAERGRIFMHRVSSPVKYEGTYLAEHPENIYGTVGPERSPFWKVVITY